MESTQFQELDIRKFTWINEPKCWTLEENVIKVKTDNKTDFWQGTWYNFHFNTGHIIGAYIKDNFSFEMCVEADFSALYDQAGVMIYVDEKYWLKSGIEYNDGQPMISSVLTNELSDWSTGVFTGDPRKFWLRLTKVDDVVCIKYSMDKSKWILLRLCPFPKAEKYFVGPMCCTPQRAGLDVRFSELSLTEPTKDILHSN